MHVCTYVPCAYTYTYIHTQVHSACVCTHVGTHACTVGVHTHMICTYAQTVHMHMFRCKFSCDYRGEQLGVTTEEHNLVRLQRSTTWCDYRGAQLGVTTEESNLV